MATPLFTNNAYSTLAGGISDSATSIVVAAGEGARFPTPTGSDYFYATLIDTSNNLEIVKVTARSTDTLTATRGAESTTARAFSTADRIELRVTAGGLTDLTTYMESLIDIFDDLYLGAKSSDPALDNDGNALADGALYFNTTDNLLQVYDLGNTTWNATSPTAAQLTDITTVAGISADVTQAVTDSAVITTVAGISANVTTVAGISANVTTVAGISADVTQAATDSAVITTVAGISANVTTVAGISANVTTVAGISADVTTVAANDANVSLVAAVDSDVTLVAAVDSDVTTVAGVSANVTTVAGISANVTTVAGISANVTTVAGISSNVTTVAGDSADIQTVAGDSADIATVAGISASVQAVAANAVGWNFDNATAMADPGSGDLRFNNATTASVTAIAIDDLDSAGADVSAFVVTWDDASNATLKGTLTIRDGTSGAWAIFSLTGLTDNAGWSELAVTHVASAGAFTAADSLFASFSVAGDDGAAGDVFNGVVAKVADYTVVGGDDDYVLTMDASGANRTFTLTAAATVGDGFVVTVKKIDSSANTVTIDADGSETIDGALTKVLSSQYETTTLICDGSNWHTVLSSTPGGSVTVDNFADTVGFTAGTSTTVTLSVAPSSETALTVTMDGVTQHHDTYSVSSTTLTFDAAIPLGVANIEVTQVAALSIGTPGDGTVVEAKLADNAVTLAKMAGGTDGNLITYDANGDPAYVATGTSAQVLTSNGAGAAPTFQAAGGGAVVLISSDTLASPVSSSDFTGFDSGTYDSYFLLLDNIAPSTDDQRIVYRTSTDGGSTFDSGASDYYHASSITTTAAITYNGTTGGTSIDPMTSVSGQGNLSTEGVSGIIWIESPDEALYTHMRWHLTHINASGVLYTVVGSGYRLSEAGVDAFRVAPLSGNIAAQGRIRFYGVKNA